ncbi:MAG: TraB/GumN family protein [Pseudomonadota bacterium]
MIDRTFCNRARRLLLAVLVALAPAAAEAACGGRDLFAPLETQDPVRYAAILEAASTVPNGQGRLWRITGPDGGVSHLFGTYHDTEAAALMSPEARSAFGEAERLVLEISEAELAAMEARMASDPFMSMRSQPIDPALLMAGLDARQRRAMEAALATRGLTVEVAAALQPWLLFAMFGVPACQIEASAQGTPVLDRQLADDAVARGVPVEGLESFTEALSVFSRFDDADTALMLRDAISVVALQEDIRRTLLNLYGRGQIGVIQSFTEDLTRDLLPGDPEEAIERNEALLSELLDARNVMWMEKLPPLLAGGGAFVAVGALHLPGEVGMVALLREAGYAVEALPEG